MKRLLIRMSVLALVVVLGCFAIAQAQRGTNESSSSTDTTPPAVIDEGAPAPILAPANSGYSTRTGMAASQVNPLRGNRPSFNELASSSQGSSQGMARNERAESADTGAAVPPRLRVATGTGSQTTDPFSLPTANNAGKVTSAANGSVLPNAVAASGAAQGKSAEIAQASADEPLPRLASMPSNSSARSAPSVLGGSAASSNATGAATASKDDSFVERQPPQPGSTASPYSGRGGAAPTRVPEPAPFKLDSSAAGNGLSPIKSSVERVAPGASAPSNNAVPSASPSSSPSEAAPSFGAGKPGARQLEGPQSPSLIVQKIGPPEVQVGKTATFQTKVRNAGQISANGVEVRDEVPKGTRLVGTTPRASQGVRGELVWQLGAIKPGDEVTVQMQVMPLEEGEIGSVATVHFSAEASVRTIATKPELVIKATGPNRASIGEEVALTIHVSNPGTGTAEGVVLEARIPPSLRHPAGADLAYDVGVLKPKESRQLELKLTAVEPGAVSLPLLARADANLKADGLFGMDVIAPRLEVAMEGPKRRFLEREATYVFSVSNPGTAPARQVQLVCQLPPGLQFVNANNSGQYEAATRTVHWLLEELPVRETGKVELVTMPTEAGEHKLVLRGLAEKGVSAEKEQPVLIEGVSAIRFDLTGLANPIVRGSETTYEIRVMNQGSKAATNVRVSLLLPPEMRAVAAEGPTRHQVESNRVVFEGLSQLAPKSDTTYRIRVQGLQPGDLRIRAQLLTDDIQTPVTKEESTRVYSDE